MARERSKKADEVPFGEEDITPVLATSNEYLDEMTYEDIVGSATLNVSDFDDVTVVDQTELEGKPFVLIGWAERSGSFGDFMAIAVVAPDGKHVFADGGVGIREQLQRFEQRLTKKGQWDQFRRSGIPFPNGLRASRYIAKVPNDDGVMQEIPATTWYFDNRK